MIIRSKKELNKILAEERHNIFGCDKISFETKFRGSFKYRYYNYLSLFRKYEFLCCQRDSANGVLHHYHALKIKFLSSSLNSLSLKIGVDFGSNDIGTGVTVCHPNVILNGTVGNGCIFHGNNVLGNKCTGSKETPTLGKNVDMGIGATVIGDVFIADNCVIGAGAVVTKSFDIPGSIIAGVPAKLIR